MNKEIYKYLKKDDIVDKLADEIVEAFKTKMNKDTVDYSFDIAKGTGKIKVIEQNTFFNFDTEESSTLEKFKKAMFHDDLEGMTQDEESLLIEDVSEILKEVATTIIKKYETEVRKSLRAAIMPKSTIGDFPFEKILVTSIDIGDWSAFTEPQKYLLRIAKKPGAYINTDVVVNYVHDRQNDTGMTPHEVFEEGRKEENPLFDEIIDVESGDKYLYDIAVSMFVDYSLAEKSMEALTEIKEKESRKTITDKVNELMNDAEMDAEEKRRQKLIKELEKNK